MNKRQSGWRAEVYRGHLTDRRFCELVRRFSTCSVVSEVARISAKSSAIKHGEQDFRKFPPWALQEIVRVSVVYGNYHRAEIATEADIGWLCVAYNAIDEPELRNGGRDGYLSFLLRAFHAQFSFQLSPASEVARSAAIFLHSGPKPGAVLNVLGSESWQDDLFGCSLADFVGTGYFLFAACMATNGGNLSWDWFEDHDFDGVTYEVPVPVLRNCVSRHFAVTPEEFRMLQGARSQHGPQRRFSFNPLIQRPVINGPRSELVIPLPQLVLRKVSPMGIYYMGVNHWGSRFSDDLGGVFETYIGRQLGLLLSVALYPEISYGKPERKSVDWIVVFAECVLLVEAKASRPPEAVRVGGVVEAKEAIDRLLEAQSQIDRTGRAISDGVAEFGAIPVDRPIVGIVVTMESWYIPPPVLETLRKTQPETPSFIWGVEQLEQLVAHSVDRPGELLLSIFERIDLAGNIGPLLATYESRPNPVLDEALNSYPWSS